MLAWPRPPESKAYPMHEFPHLYVALAKARPEGEVVLSSLGLPDLACLPPVEFDGPGDHWSPETLLTGALANCFVLSFRTIAKASQFPWVAIECNVEGTLTRVERVTRFTEFHTRVVLTASPGTKLVLAQRLLEKAKHACLISNSLSAPNHLETSVRILEA